MTVFNTGLNLYRKTVKHIRPLHVAVHAVMTHVLIPILERMNSFKTIPDDPFWFRLELLTGKHEQETIQQIERLLKPGMVFLDVGAHVGYYARKASKLVGQSGKVIAFEPHPKTFAILSENLANSKNVTPLQLAVAEQEGTAELHDYLMMSASGSLHYDESLRNLQKSQITRSDIAPRIAEDFPVQTFVVRTTTIDTCLSEQNIEQIDVVKMDIEGAELSALRGMQQTINQSPNLKLIMEYNPQALKTSDIDPVEALKAVLGMGFSRVQVIEVDGTLTDITDDDTAIVQLTKRLMSHMDVVNLLFERI